MTEKYPVLDIVNKLKASLVSSGIVILQAPPGAGKSTVLPLKLMDEAWPVRKKIIMLEPRRLATKSVAERMADLLHEKAGDQVGYRIRFDTKVSSRTRIEVVTEGILTRMIQADSGLKEVGLLIFDEFHERSLHADLALALSLQVRQVLRDDLRILIMSATLDGEHLSSLLANAPLITAHGKQFPVEIKYQSRELHRPIVQSTTAAIKKAMREEDGDVLVFLPGAGEIQRVQELLEAEAEAVDAVIHPLYGDLSFKKQQEAIVPDSVGKRKIVLATSIAETSLTIEGIRIVVDSGLSRIPRFDPRTGLTRLETVRVTKDAADQRAGRAGRTGPGTCYRLWTEGTQLNLAPQRKPEITEADLAPMMLELAQWGIRDVKELKWITLPPAGAVNQAKELLEQLDAIDERGVITDRGKKMVSLPTHPRIAHLLLEAGSSGESKAESDALKCLAADIAALLEERDFLPPEVGADLILRIDHLRRWRNNEKIFADVFRIERIDKLAASWRKLLKVGVSNAMPSHYQAGKLLLAAYPERIAQQQGRHNERYKLANGRMVKLATHDPLIREPWLAVAHLDAGNGEGKIFLAAPLHEDDLLGHAREREVVRWDSERNMVAGVVERTVGGLLLKTKPLQKVDNEKRIEVICNTIRHKGLKMLSWGNDQAGLQARIMSLKAWRPHERWPDVTEVHLLQTLDDWLTPYLGNIYKQTELEQLDLNTILLALLPWELHNRMDVLAPSRLRVPSGSMINVQYFPDGRAPIIEVRLQEMFGLSETPAVNEGRTKVLLHLLSPGYKPVQVTQDLKSFWRTTYHEVRKKLRVRYPKHHWPEDPWNAEAVRGVKRNR